MKYKYSRKEIVDFIKDNVVIYDIGNKRTDEITLIKRLLAKSTKPKSTPKPDKIEDKFMYFEPEDYQGMIMYLMRKKTEMIEVINYVLEKEK